MEEPFREVWFLSFPGWNKGQGLGIVVRSIACKARGGPRSGAISLVLLLAVSGCALPSLKPPSAGKLVPASWAETSLPPVNVDIARYWTELHDPLITSLVKQAIANNLDIAQSAARLDQARASLKAARAGYFPTLSANGGVSHDVGDLASNKFGFSVGANASWEIGLFGRISGSVAVSRADLAAAGYSLADVQRLVVGQVAISAINARAIARQLAIARSTLAHQDDNLRIARWRNEAGLVSSLDVEQARAQRAQTAATIPALESSLAATANAISTLIGQPPGKVLAQFSANSSKPAAVPVPTELKGFEAPAAVLRRRPDVRGAEANLIAASAQVGVARAQLRPLLQLTGNIGTSSQGISSLFDLITGGLMANVSQLLFDGGRTAAQLAGAKAAAQAALAAWKQSILSALEEVESAAVAQRTANQRVTITEQAVDAAHNSAILARSQYQAGLIDFATLLTAENQLLSARNQLVGARADRAIAFVQLTQALGGGWTPGDDTAPLPDSNAKEG